MKKTYQQPTLVVTLMEQSLPIATSLEVVNTAQDGISGDVNSAGDWDNIWDE